MESRRPTIFIITSASSQTGRCKGLGEGFDRFTPELVAFHMGIFKMGMLRGDYPELTARGTKSVRSAEIQRP